MSENLPALYLGCIEFGKLIGGWAEYLPEELILYFVRLFPIPGTHLFLSARGELFDFKSEDLCRVKNWQTILGETSNQVSVNKDTITQLLHYFGVKL